MKTMKVALLATAALAAVTVSARADDASALKAELAALNARVAQLEASPALPVGYSLLTVSEASSSATPGVVETDLASYGDKATVIGIMPTADMPASTTIEWSGFVRAAIAYFDKPGATGTGGDDEIDVWSRGEIKVKAKTDTSVGEVGVMMKLRADFNITTSGNPGVVSPEYWGYWAMTPELTLGGGFTGTLANIGYGYDGACSCYYTDNADAAFNPGDESQMRLSYASGPMSFAIAVEDGSVAADSDDSIGVAAELKYTGDTVSGEISGGWWGADDFTSIAAGGNDAVAWQVGAGLGFALGDMANLSLAVAGGEFWGGRNYIGASALVSANLSDTVHAEVAVAYKDYSGSTFFPTYSYNDAMSVLGGIYYEPVSQLTIGLEAEHTNPKGAKNNTTSVDLVTVFRF
jgi:hypothetical protein